MAHGFIVEWHVPSPIRLRIGALAELEQVLDVANRQGPRLFDRVTESDDRYAEPFTGGEGPVSTALSPFPGSYPSPV